MDWYPSVCPTGSGKVVKETLSTDTNVSDCLYLGLMMEWCRFLSAICPMLVQHSLRLGRDTEFS